MAQGTSEQPASGVGTLARGFWIGALFAACAMASWPILVLAIDTPWSINLVPGSLIAILVIGYLAGLAAAIRRPTRRLGLGILIGVTVAAPVLFMLTWTVLYAIWGGQ